MSNNLASSLLLIPHQETSISPISLISKQAGAFCYNKIDEELLLIYCFNKKIIIQRYNLKWFKITQQIQTSFTSNNTTKAPVNALFSISLFAEVYYNRFLVLFNSNVPQYLFAFDFEETTWKYLQTNERVRTAMPDALLGVQLVAVQDGFIITGGLGYRPGNQYCKETWRFCFKTTEWQLVKDQGDHLNSCAYYLYSSCKASADDPTSCYFFGGYFTSCCVTNNVRKLNASTGVWQLLSDMDDYDETTDFALTDKPTQRTTSAITLIDDTIFIYGGDDESLFGKHEPLNDLHSFNVKTKTWRKYKPEETEWQVLINDEVNPSASCPPAHCDMRMVTDGYNLYLYGGVNKQVLEYSALYMLKVKPKSEQLDQLLFRQLKSKHTNQSGVISVMVG